MTVATCVETDEELQSLESRHICPEMVLADLLNREKSIQFRSNLN
jgi:hypothetical protein